MSNIVTNAMVDRFLCWKLPQDFSPDCGISFDGRKDDEWNKNKTWPVGTNLFTAEQARKMLEYVLNVLAPCPICNGPVRWHGDAPDDKHSCDGCHEIFCPKCQMLVDMSIGLHNDYDNLDELRGRIAEKWNQR